VADYTVVSEELDCTLERPAVEHIVPLVLALEEEVEVVEGSGFERQLYFVSN
jgi:hypothetical protein